nr:hypothetical protein [Armatimonas sp.]
MRPIAPRFVLAFLGGFAALALVMRFTRPHTPPHQTPEFPRTNTWHLSGTCIIEGKSLPWEIWGQAEPAFQYERRGAAIRTSTVSSGEILLPPLPNAPQVVLRGLPASGRNHLATLAQSAQQEKDLLTGLPTRYLVKDRKTGQPLGELAAHYNQPLPEVLREPLSAPGARVYRLLPQPPDAPPQSQVSAYGVTIQGKVIEQDREGNIRLALSAQPSSKPPLALTATVSVSEYNISVGPMIGVTLENRTPPRDDQKGLYVPVTYQGTDGIWLRLVPLAPKAPRPRTIRLSVWVEPTLRPDAAQLLPDARLTRGRVWLTLPLPATCTSQLLSSPAIIAKQRQIYQNVFVAKGPTPRRTGTTVY